MGKLTRKYKKNIKIKSMKKHKVSKKSRKSRHKKIIHIKKSTRKRRRTGGGSDGESDDEELYNIETGITRNKSISSDHFDIESGRESMTPVIQRKNKIPTVKPSPTARTQSPFVSIFSGFSGSLDNLTKSISPYSRKIPSTYPNISSSSADSEEGGVTNTSVPLPKYDEQLSGIEVHSQEYQNYLTHPNIKKYKALPLVVFESVKKQFSSFLDKLGYKGINKEELMNKLTDPDFIHNLDTLMDKMSKKQTELEQIRNTLIGETQKNARESLIKDEKERIKNANK